MAEQPAIELIFTDGEFDYIRLDAGWREHLSGAQLTEQVTAQINQRHHFTPTRTPNFGRADQLGVDELRRLRHLLDAYNHAALRMAERRGQRKPVPAEQITEPPLVLHHVAGLVLGIDIPGEWLAGITSQGLVDKLEELLRRLPAPEPEQPDREYAAAVENLEKFWSSNV